ncbi:MAG: hypothetical protein FWE74_08540 [Oscillospiraceae bacterium]|nr:hypothetical protein [Oscillospiraceae bacterium]
MELKTIEVHDLAKAAQLVTYVESRQSKKAHCTDFIGHFYRDGLYCMVYSSADGIALQSRLDEDLPLETRLQIACDFIAALVNKRIDFETAAAIRLENIMIDGTRIGFVYSEPPVINIIREKAFAHIANIIETIFGEPSVLKGWLNDFKNVRFASFPEAFIKMPQIAELSESSEIIKNQTPTKELEHDGYWSFKSFYLKKKPIIAAVSIVPIIVVLVFTVVIPAYRHMTQLEKDNELLSLENVLFMGDNAQLSADNELFLSDNERLSNDNGQLMNENIQLTVDNTQLKSENMQLTADNTQLIADKIQLRDEIEELKAEIAEGVPPPVIIFAECGYCYDFGDEDEEGEADG